jgi:nucleoside-diphosphate-sugar epimerase
VTAVQREPGYGTGAADALAPNVVVTGASGWLGQNLVRAVAAQAGRHRVRCLVRTEDDAARLEVVHPAIEAVVGDVRDPAALDRCFDGLGGATVFHAAAVIHPARAVREMFDVNVGGTQLTLDRARRVQATRFVHVSSNSPFGANDHPEDRFTEDDPYAPYLGYGQSKCEAEQLVRASQDRGDLQTVILRPPWFYGPFQPPRQTQFFSAVRKGRFPVVAPGTQRRSMVFTGNLVQAMLRAEVVDRAAGRAYWIADAQPYELGEIIATVRAALRAEGVPVTRRPAPRIPRSAALLAAQADRILQGAGRYVQPMHVLGELKDTIACDITRARDELGYEPTIGLLEGMRISVRWCLERGAAL